MPRSSNQRKNHSNVVAFQIVPNTKGKSKVTQYTANSIPDLCDQISKNQSTTFTLESKLKVDDKLKKLTNETSIYLHQKDKDKNQVDFNIIYYINEEIKIKKMTCTKEDVEHIFSYFNAELHKCTNLNCHESELTSGVKIVVSPKYLTYKEESESQEKHRLILNPIKYAVSSNEIKPTSNNNQEILKAAHKARYKHIKEVHPKILTQYLNDLNQDLKFFKDKHTELNIELNKLDEKIKEQEKNIASKTTELNKLNKLKNQKTDWEKKQKEVKKLQNDIDKNALTLQEIINELNELPYWIKLTESNIERLKYSSDHSYEEFITKYPTDIDEFIKNSEKYVTFNYSNIILVDYTSNKLPLMVATCDIIIPGNKTEINNDLHNSIKDNHPRKKTDIKSVSKKLILELMNFSKDLIDYIIPKGIKIICRTAFYNEVEKCNTNEQKEILKNLYCIEEKISINILQDDKYAYTENTCSYRFYVDDFLQINLLGYTSIYSNPTIYSEAIA